MEEAQAAYNCSMSRLELRKLNHSGNRSADFQREKGQFEL